MYYYKDNLGNKYALKETRTDLITITEEEFNYKKTIAKKTKVIDTGKKEISRLKHLLSSTDYQAIKYAEGLLTEEEYAPIKAKRQQYRDRINELEGR